MEAEEDTRVYSYEGPRNKLIQSLRKDGFRVGRPNLTMCHTFHEVLDPRGTARELEAGAIKHYRVKITGIEKRGKFTVFNPDTENTRLRDFALKYE